MGKLLLFLFVSALSFAQNVPGNTEELIYKTIDDFTTNASLEKLKTIDDFVAKIQPKTNDEFLALVILYCNKAYYENQYGLTQESISSYETAWQLFLSQKSMNYDIVEYCLKPLGNLYTKMGDYDNAEYIIKSYLYIANKEKDSKLIYAGILNLSNVYQSSGRLQMAIDLLEDSLKSRNLSELQTAILLNNLGTNYTLNQKNELAEKAFKKAILLLKNKNEPETLANSYRNLAQLYNSSNQFDKSNKAFENAQLNFIKIQNPLPRQLAKLHLEKAIMLKSQKKSALAMKEILKIYAVLINGFSNQNLFPKENQLYAETVLLDALDLQANLFLEQNQLEKTLEIYDLAFHIEELFQWILVHENSKIINQQRNKNRVENCIEIYHILYQKEKNNHYLEKAFALAELNKSVVLKVSIEKFRNSSTEEKILMEQLQEWNSALLKEQKKENASLVKINQAIEKQNKIVLLLKSKSNQVVQSTYQTIDFSSLFDKLEKDKAILISYFYGVEKLYIFKIENRQITLYTIENSPKEKMIISDFLNYFKDPNTILNNSIGYNQQANLVYNYLKIPKKSTQKNLLILPDGIINFIPFEALITKKSTTASFSKMNYLLHDFKIAYNSSVSFYLNQKKWQYKNESILGIFPIFENSPSELTFSKNEANYIKNNFTGLFLENSDASFINFKKNSPNYSILHLSTHASSGDQFVPATIHFYQEEISYAELYSLNTNPDLVVLSACETGIGKLYQSEGALSISRGFQMAGVQNLLFSLWKVNDYTTSVLMKNFYSNLKNNHSYFESNHQSKIDFLNDKSLSNSKKSPYYWSAMAYYGTFEQKPQTTYWYYFLLFPLLVLLLVIIRKYIR